MLLCILAVALLASAGFAAGLSVSPAQVADNYQGAVTINITGLSAGQSVLLERYIDVNGNGVVDAGEPCVISLPLTDGNIPTIGGVRNTNVPGDEDGAVNGQIQAVRRFPGLDSLLERITASSLYRVSDPATGSTLATAAFAVTPAALPQGIHGHITAQSGGAAIPYAIVVALTPQDGRGCAGTLAGADGSYTLYVDPGTYVVLAVSDGFTGSMGSGPVSVSSGIIQPHDCKLPASTRTVRGRAYDPSTNAGLGGMFVDANTESYQFNLAFSHPDGTYSLSVDSGAWSAGPDSDNVAEMGRVRPEKDSLTPPDTTQGDVTGYDFAFPSFTALIYGHVRDTSGAAVAGLALYAESQNTYATAGQSDSTGRYSLGVTGAQWNYGLDDDCLAAKGYVCLDNWKSDLPQNGQALQRDFTVAKVTAHISGHVRDAQGNAISGVNVYAHASINGQTVWLNAETDDGGYYNMGVINGDWTVGVDCGGLQERGFQCVQEQTRTVSGADRTLDFTAVRDTTPPQLQYCDPSDGTTGVSTGHAISFYFNETMKPQQAIQWSSNLNPASFSYTWSDYNQLLTCVYSEALPAGAEIQWTLNPSGTANGFQDCAGNSLGACSGHFTTAGQTGLPAPTVTGEGLFTTSRDTLRATITASCPVQEYGYAIGTTPTDPGEGYVVEWKSNGASGQVEATGLSLNTGQAYYVYGGYRDTNGAESESGASDGITVVDGAYSSPGAAKAALEDGRWAGLSGVRVTASPAQTGVGSMYVEDTLRSSGIRVESQDSFAEGEQIDVCGALATATGGERRLVSARTLHKSYEDPLKPFAVSLRAGNSAPFFWSPASSKGQAETADGVGNLSTVGLLVTVCGQVASAGAADVTLDDGSFDSGRTVAVDARYAPFGLKAGDYAVITGISTLDSGTSAMRILPRKAEDFQVVHSAD